MDEHLRAAGRSITLRHTVNRWLEYAMIGWTVALLALIVGKWQGWPIIPIVAALVSLGCLCAAVAALYNIQCLESERRERVLTKRHAAERRQQK